MSYELKRFARGFLYAGHGVCTAVWRERNVRFHLCAAVYALTLGWLAELDAMGFALLFLCIGGVLGLELMNSALEQAVDKPDAAHWGSAGAAKDMAAGGVLVMALCTVAVALCLMGQPATLARIWSKVTATPVMVLCWAGSLGIAFLFVFCFGAKKESESI